MPLKVHNGTSFVNSTPSVYNGAAWDPVRQGSVWSGTVWEQFFTTVSGTASPTAVSGYNTAPVGIERTVTTGLTTVTASGGTAPYTYEWSLASGIGDATINSPTSASTRFSAVLLCPGSASGYYRCKVTDATGVYGYSNSVDVSISLADDGTTPP